MGLDYSGTDIPIVHLEIVKDSSVSFTTRKVQTPADMAEMFEQVIGKRNTENMLVCAVDARKQPVLLQITGTGSTEACQFSISDIWKTALLSNASAVIVAHNHPSGDVYPGGEDIEATKKIIAAGNMIGIRCLDHVIVSRDSHYSFYENMPHLWQ